MQRCTYVLEYHLDVHFLAWGTIQFNLCASESVFQFGETKAVLTHPPVKSVGSKLSALKVLELIYKQANG